MSVYKFLELVGTSPNSWEEAAANAVNMATESLRDVRVADVLDLDMHIENNKITSYRAKVKISFKVEKHNI